MKLNLTAVALSAATMTLAWSAKAQSSRPETRPSAAEAFSHARTGDAPGGASTNSDFSKRETAIDREIADLKQKAGRSQTNATLLVQLGDALMQKSRESTDGRLYDEAESAYKRALAADTQDEDAMVGLAWVFNSRHEFEAGKRWAEKALAINPAIPRAHALLGDAAVEWGAYDDAFRHYQEALDLRPDLSSYSRAAHLMWLTGDTRKAQWLMEKAIAAGAPHAENTAWCRAQLALMSFQTGALLPAEQQAAAGLKETPDNPHLLAVMSKIKMAKKEYDAAIELCRRVIEITPNHDSLVMLGDLYVLSGRREEAEQQFERVVDFHTTGAAHSHGGSVHTHSPNDGNAQLARFFADHDRNLEEALREAQAAYRSYTNVFVADTLAWCFYKTDRLEEAAKTIQIALKWNTPDAAILFHAGMIHAKRGDSQRGDRETAKKFLYRALNLNPQFDAQQAVIAVETLKSLSAAPAATNSPSAQK